MKRIFLVFVASLMLSFNALALDTNSVASAGFENLTEKQKAVILHDVAKQAESNLASNGKPISADTAAKQTNELLNIGERIGKGFAGAAKELGVAANDFAKTDVGKWVVFLLIWHFFGNMAVHIFFGLTFLVLGVWFVYHLSQRFVPTCVEYNKDVRNVFGNHPKIKVERPALSSDDYFALLLTSGGVVIVSAITLFAGW